MGPVNAECPASLHSAPFGNWGVTSNFGSKHDDHQFDGWCHDTKICDNIGICRTECKDGWYEWNSCTDNVLFQPPNCTLYNTKDCAEQTSTTGINVLGTQTADVPVSCPYDSDGDGIFDKGGCSNLKSYSHGSNFMSLYELDPGTADELVQTLYFPDTVVNLDCTVWSCPPAGSDWVAPVFYDNPTSPARVYAEMAVVVNSGTFLDLEQSCRAASLLTTVSAASYQGTTVALASIASAFGGGLAPVTEQAASLPLPTSMSGVTVRVKDSAGAERDAPLFFISPGQINYLVPEGSQIGPATARVENGGQIVATGTIQIVRVAPGIFSANSSGEGAAAAVAVKVATDGSQTWQLTAQCSSPGNCISVPVDLGTEADQVILLLFGTGIRGRTALSAVTATIGGVSAEVQYAGPQEQFAGLDQVNVQVPRSLTGRGEVNIVLTVDGTTANTVKINIK